MDADGAVEELVALVERFPQLEDIHVFGMLPCESVDSCTERLRYVAEKVLPEVRKRLALTRSRE